MTKKTEPKPNFTKRVGNPTIAKDEQGNAMLLCPFCTPTHTLHPQVPSPCGTQLILTAEQVVFKAKYIKGMVCVKCKKPGGEMVRFQNAYVHTHDCAPGVMTMTIPPTYSKAAAVVHKIKVPFVKDLIERYTGKAMQVDEVTGAGERTGTVLGYFFHKDVSHAKRIETSS